MTLLALVLGACSVEGPPEAIHPAAGRIERPLMRTPPPHPLQTAGEALLTWETREDGLKIADRVVGEGDRVPEGAALLTVEVTGWLPDGTRWWSTYETPHPTRFLLGQAPVRAWDRGVVGMRVGGVRLLDVPPSLAFGEDGATRRVPPDSPVVFEIELLALQQPPGRPLPFEEAQKLGNFEVIDVLPGGGEMLDSERHRGARIRFDRTEWLPNGTLLGSSRLEPVPPTVVWGEGRLRWEEAMAGMREGGIRQVRVPGDPSLGGPGEEGAPVVLPAGSPLILSIELHEIE